ncbi:tumor necrosis factor receptor superfamily member 10D [Nomascus leucogenys]|uniref:tumor necrosis factor receptor superfamily member 10D n=1 Tax=Nomascus leucogenys TaxID=61853 RepID=UPI00122D80EA|nr:tumor necrosis factor receptor superfamily member 10D [Nomascus leucogenys]
MGLWGQSAPTASSARAGRYPGARTASGTRPWLLDPKTLKFVVFIVAVLLPVQVDSATIRRQDEVPQQTVIPQQQRRSLKEEECPAGSHRSEHTGACNPCTEGVDYTIASNNLPSCLLCTVCKSGQTNKSSCTTTRDTVCQCEKGSFQDKNSPEMCRKCRTGCPRGMVKVSDCMPWSDINCSASAASSTGKTPAAEKTPTIYQETPASTNLAGIGIGASVIPVVAVVFCILCRKKLISYLKGICSGGGGGPECVHRVLFRRRSCPSQVPGAEDNARNETLTSRYLQPTQVSEQEIQGQELAEPTGVTVESPEEPQRLLEQAEAEGCQRRRLLVPMNDADPNEISTLLDASATLEEGHAKETIQDQLVGSEKLFYEEDEAGSATSCL